MTDITRIEDHSGDALKRVIDQFSASTRYQDLIRSFVDPCQDIEDAIYQLLTQRSVDTATGQQLDNLGAIVDQAREGRSDDDYRLWINVRILVNRSTGTANDSLAVMQLIEPTSTFALVEHYPAAYSVNAYGLVGDPQTVFDVLYQVKPSGVAFWLEWSDLQPSFLFTMGDSASPTTDPDTGFGDSADLNTGGHMTGVID